MYDKIHYKLKKKKKKRKKPGADAHRRLSWRRGGPACSSSTPHGALSHTLLSVSLPPGPRSSRHSPNLCCSSSSIPLVLAAHAESVRPGTHPLNVHAPGQPLQLREVLLVGYLLPGAGPPAVLLPALHPGGDAWTTRTLRGPSRTRRSSLLPRRPADRCSAGI